MVCQSPAQSILMWEHPPWSKTDLQKEKRTANLQAKAENRRERERLRRGDGDRACNCPISQEGRPEIAFHEILPFPYYKSTVIILQWNDSWLRHKLGVDWWATGFQSECEICCGVPAGQRKMPCRGTASSLWKAEKGQPVHLLCVLNCLLKTQARASLTAKF